MVIKYQIILSLKYSTIGHVCVVYGMCIVDPQLVIKNSIAIGNILPM